LQAEDQRHFLPPRVPKFEFADSIVKSSDIAMEIAAQTPGTGWIMKKIQSNMSFAAIAEASRVFPLRLPTHAMKS
jgi:hypothetical protein